MEWITKISCYVSPAGNNKIEEWYRGLSATEKSDADTFLDEIRKTKTWSMPDYRLSLRNGEGLGELRWYSGNKQHRLLGFFHHGQWIAVIGCTHKQQIYNPADCLESGKRRMKQIERGEASTVEYDL